jgi:hypothetical protein
MSRQASTLVASTLVRVENASSDPELQRIAADLMKYATPGEVQSLVESLTAASPFRNWLRDLYANITRHIATPAPFRCDYSSDAVSHYSVDDGARILIAGFCGKSQLIHGPTAVLLQNLPHSADVLVLRDRGRQGFTKGIPDFADSFPGLIERLRAEFDLGRYEDIRCLGGSSGAAAAFAMGQMLGASKLVSFGGRSPSRSEVYGDTPDAAVLEGHITSGPPGTGRAFAVYGNGNANDFVGAESLARLLDVTLVPVDDVEHHNIIRPLHKRGELPAVLRTVGLL